MYKLIPTEERHKYHCCVCGTTRSVKYLIPTMVIDALGSIGVEKPYCNRCALLLSQLTEKIRRNQND